MSLTFVASGPTTINGSGTAINITAPAGIQSGDLIVVSIMHRSPINSVPAGFSLVGVVSWSDVVTQYTSVYSKVSSGNETTISFSQLSSGRSNGDASAYRGTVQTPSVFNINAYAGELNYIRPIGGGSECFAFVARSFVFSADSREVSFSSPWVRTAGATQDQIRIGAAHIYLPSGGAVDGNITPPEGNSDAGTVQFVIAESDPGPAPLPKIRTTQAAKLILTRDGIPLRTTQAATLVLAKDSQPIRTTQAAILIHDYTISQLRQTQAAVLCLTAETPCLTQRCQVWKITRADGITFAFTTHDEPVKWMGLTHKPCDSLRASASDSGIINSGSIGDTTVNGVLSDDSITEFDLANGLFDGAKVDVWLVPWNDSVYVTDQPQRIAAGVLGKTSQGGITYTAEMLSPGSKLVTRPLLEHYTPACRFELGDGRCPVDLDALRVSSTVTNTVQRDAFSRRTFRQFVDSSLLQADGYFEFGKLVWTGGQNAGISSEVKEYAGGVVTLWQPMPHEIQVGDTYTIEPGCDKSKADHQTKFGLNMVSFGGFPDIPGQDVLMRTPNAKG